MDRFQQELNKLTGTDFFQLAKRESNPRTRIRLLALGHLQSGKTKTEVVDMFQVVFPTLREWLLRFIAEGIEGLREKRGKGRKRKLSAEQEEYFRQQVEALQKSREGGRVRGQDIKVLLKEKFCVDHALPSVYHVLERCGLSWISARSKHPKSDPAVQEDFKKNSKKK
jgi:transposase